MMDLKGRGVTKERGSVQCGAMAEFSAPTRNFLIVLTLRWFNFP